VRQGLQADCFAGIWANHARPSQNAQLESGDIEAGLNAMVCPSPIPVSATHPPTRAWPIVGPGARKRKAADLRRALASDGWSRVRAGDPVDEGRLSGDFSRQTDTREGLVGGSTEVGGGRG
jgi:hypothetical protein